MLIAFNGATTMHADLETDIRISGQAGYDLLEIWAAKMETYLGAGNVQSIRSLMAQAGIKPFSINSVEHINLRSAEDYKGIQKQLRRYCALAQELECENIVVVPSPNTVGARREEIYDDAVQVLRDLSGIAGEYGVRLAFEMLGQVGCSVSTLGDAWEIVKRVDRDNVGLVLDTFHFYAGGSRLESIMDMDARKLFIFHINDSEPGPKEQLTDAQRLLPGEGVIPLPDICRGLRNIGYKRMVSIELFRPEYWEWAPLKLATAAKHAVDKVVNSVWG